ncbi:hypothetical protein IU470_04415 [Nocardia abscessus]|uniref:Uncharacterized protein n=1 Tax=Nocardia abscessus TaxID=120957 RepID=A0ABS0C449_9NOCA|nr:hypothetical protein [Nocardia abscessus]
MPAHCRRHISHRSEISATTNYLAAEVPGDIRSWLIPVGPVDELVATYGQDPGARVEYIRDHFSEHLTLDPIGAPRAMLWSKDHFAGIPVAEGVTVHRCRLDDLGPRHLASVERDGGRRPRGRLPATRRQRPLARRARKLVSRPCSTT